VFACLRAFALHVVIALGLHLSRLGKINGHRFEPANALQLGFVISLARNPLLRSKQVPVD
jgi:hypothetical protein